LEIGQLLIIGFDGIEMNSQLSSLLRELQPAGVILFMRNIRSAEQTWQLLRDCRKCVTTPLFTCVDLEGGTVDRLRNVLGPTPSAAEVFACADRKLFRKHGQILGENCRVLGFNVDFAPSFDLKLAASKKVMGSRVVSANPRDVVAYAHEFLAGLRKANVLGCGKHFPGLGEGNLDSHHALPVIDKPFKTLWAEDLFPYRELRRQIPFVMVAHAAYPQVTRDCVPASLSSTWIANILRRRIGYRGLILSDDLEMGGVLAAALVGDAAVQSIRAGSDMLLVCHHESLVREAWEGLLKVAETDSRFSSCVAKASQRALELKKKWKKVLRPGKSPSSRLVENLSRKLWEFTERVRLESLSE
jgi:beta-N-acetylhexosaminidase